MRSSAKHGAPENARGISAHVLTLHQRLYHALNLGCRSSESRGKWQCPDIEIQRLVLRSVDAFLDCISTETLQYPLVKVFESYPLARLSSMLFPSYVSGCIKKDSVVDMVRALGSILEFKSQSILRLASGVVAKLVNILPSPMLQSHVLDLISPLADLLSSQQVPVAISCATSMNVILTKISSRQEREVSLILDETKVVGYLVHNVKQFCVDDKPIEYIQEMASVLSKILWRWSSFRFCVWSDPKFLSILDAIRLVPGNSMKVAVLQLYSSLALCGYGAEKLLENGETLLQMMVGCMDSSNTYSVRMEAFKLARCLMLSRRGCEKMMRICCEPLVKAVMSTMNNWRSESEKLDKSQMSVMEEACRLASIARWAGDHHSYLWKYGVDRLFLDLLVDNHTKIQKLQRELSVHDLITVVQESQSANLPLSFRPYLWDILGGLAANCAENIDLERHGNELRLSVLIICACSSFVNSVGALCQVSRDGPTNMAECESATRAVLMMVYSPCKCISSLARSILCEILKSSGRDYVEYLLKILSRRLAGNNLEDFSEARVIQELQEICRNHNSHGSRWYAAYILSYFGIFGFPSKLGKRIGKSLGEKEHSDLKLDLANDESVYVHEVILTVRCPSLLPRRESVPKEKSSIGSNVKPYMERRSIKAVRLSAHVDQQSLLKLLEYVYLGYLQASEDLVKKAENFCEAL
ncbi:UNVERIFIED_CONTAM: BTB/POZ domain-containing protein [Sesamum radiatum]|uniref:BTB/POZ domain-containing protein n=1 Tax=Sesamum radiatum TaxID=300843 RepID=A0AAW2KJ09_SESRA